MPAPTTLILIHGATGNGRMWDAVRRHLDPRWQVHTPDLPGHGSRRSESFTLDAAVATVIDVVSRVAPARVVVGGDSLGGYVSLASAPALPAGQLAALVLSGSSANFTGGALRALQRRWLTMRVMRALLGDARIVAMVAKELRKQGIDAGDVQAIVDGGLNPAVFGECVQALRDIDFRARAAQVAQPVLVLNGSKDRIFIDQEDAFVAALQRPARQRFEGCDHGVSLRRPREFAAAIDAFVASALADPAAERREPALHG
ncbi:MAG: alpha/beta hydrolase [Rubrivivax sp.]|nr:alpha/beta hydrolase [Rubrivivax sp.]